MCSKQEHDNKAMIKHGKTDVFSNITIFQHSHVTESHVINLQWLCFMDKMHAGFKHLKLSQLTWPYDSQVETSLYLCVLGE